MKRLSWSKLFTFAALVSLGLTANAAVVPDRIPAPYPTTNPLVTSATPRAEFEGPAQSDFFNGNGTLGSVAPVGGAQIAVGPEDILLVANDTIWRLPNGNAAGVVPTGLYPGAQLIGGQAFGAQRVFLDNWIGTTALAQLCPSTVQNPGACQFDNATVVYDQMQGRFLVLFTVVDTGVTPDNNGGFHLTRPRKASWVLIVSRFATLLDQACFQGTSSGGTCTAVTAPNAAGTFAFIPPTPPSNNTGGIATNLWGIVYGNSVDTASNSGLLDGFGSDLAFGGVGVGNINSLPAMTGGALNALNSFDCSAGAVYATQANTATLGSKVCYFPTSARLGVDNDTVTIASAVVNTNINGADLSLFYNPITNGGTQTLPAFAGTRIRVIKKTALYIKLFSPIAPLLAGNQFAGAGATRTLGDYYDLFSSPSNNGQPVDNTTGANAGPPMPFTALASNNPCNVSTTDSFQGTGGNVTRCAPIFYEPAHLRGRALASYSNLPIGSPTNSALQSSQTYLLGAISYDTNSTTVSTTSLYIQGVREMYGFGTSPNNSFGPLPFYPVLQNGTNLETDFGRGFPSMVPVSFYSNPALAPQQTFTNGTPAPPLFVGDARPHAVIFREGHLYDARVVNSNFPGQGQFAAGTPLSTTVAYEIVQKLNASTAGTTAYQDKWQNQTAFAPMFDVPANVAQYGVGNPINGLPFLEKLFVGTTYPPLAGLPDTSYNSAPAGTPAALVAEGDFVGGDPRSRLTFGSTGLSSTQAGALANCYSSALSPTVAGVALSWVSLFDTRCGQDAYDFNPVIRDPRSGALAATYALGSPWRRSAGSERWQSLEFRCVCSAPRCRCWQQRSLRDVCR
jgi:hypothetical protein